MMANVENKMTDICRVTNDTKLPLVILQPCGFVSCCWQICFLTSIAQPMACTWPPFAVTIFLFLGLVSQAFWRLLRNQLLQLVMQPTSVYSQWKNFCPYCRICCCRNQCVSPLLTIFVQWTNTIQQIISLNKGTYQRRGRAPIRRFLWRGKGRECLPTVPRRRRRDSKTALLAESSAA